MRKIICYLLSLILVISLAGCAANAPQPSSASETEISSETADGTTESPSETADGSTESQEETAKVYQNIVIVYTNDVHCGIDKNVGYAAVSAYRNKMAEEGNAVLLVDNGDHIQGDVAGTLTKGEAIINIMNVMNYDLAVPGNHEFDYGMEQFLDLAKMASFPYISCNFTDLRTGELVFEPYKILEAAGKKIAFVGVTTPTSLVSSTPKYFQDESGNYIYGFCAGDNGQELYSAVQKAVDDAHEEGCDYCILVSHLGINASDAPYMSTDVITHTTGIDVVLDGHSHSVVDMEKVKNADGRDVVLTQDGYQIPSIGVLTIDAAGNIKSELITDFTDQDPKITSVIDDEKAKYEDVLDQVVGESSFDMRASIDGNSTWLVRNNETNLGDLLADMVKAETGAEIGFINGGGIRANLPAGTITYSSLLSVFPFSNTIVARNVTGKELADALELSVYAAPDFFGGFLQVSGITFDVDLSVPSPVVLDDNLNLVSIGDGERRVSNIKVGDEPLDPERTYVCGSLEYIIKNGGNGYTMFNGEMVEMDRYAIDVDALADYIKSIGGRIPDEYSDPDGQERIHFIN